MIDATGAVGAAAAALIATAGGRYLLRIFPPAGMFPALLVSYVLAALGQLVVPRPAWDAVGGFHVLPSLLAALIPWFWWWNRQRAVVCEGLVSIAIGPRGFTAAPYSVCLALARHLHWVVDVPDGQRVVIEFSDKRRGPFLQDHANQHNPRRGRYEIVGAGRIHSNAAELTGRWVYSITDGGSTAAGAAGTPNGPIEPLDPEICVRGG